MIFEEKTIILKDGRTAILKSPCVEDAEKLLNYIKKSCSETDFLARYPEEWTTTIGQEEAWVNRLRSAPDTLGITCYVDGEDAGNCEISFRGDMKVISFYDPKDGRGGARLKEYNPINYNGICDCVFTVGIHDIDIEILGEYGLTYETYFPEVEKLADFIYTVVEQGMDIICQCEYGQSRSAACAAAIKEHFEKSGIEVFADYRYYPNQLIFNKLRDALSSWKQKKQK